MTSLDFLYIALGGGFILLVIFTCVLLVFLILILRDISQISRDAKDISHNVRLSTEKVTEYVVEPIKFFEGFMSHFGFLRDVVDRVKEEVAKRTHGHEEEDTSSRSGRKKKS